VIKRYALPEMSKIWSEANKFRKWLQVELLVCEALKELGQIPARALARIKERAEFDLERIAKVEEKTKHDMVAFLEVVSRTIGPEARYLHLGLTSYDIEDTALAFRMVEAADIIIDDLKRLITLLGEKAMEHKKTLMVGRTHGVHAEPITFGLKLAGWMEETRRNLARMESARANISYGKVSGAVGTYATVDPRVEDYVCRKLGLKSAGISTQILQRDRHAEYLTTLAIIASSLDKFAIEIRNLQRTEILEVEEYFFEAQKGSSAMPHKRNPVTCERISGLARVVRSNALASLENVGLWGERDISHSSVERVIIPDSTILVDYMLKTFIDIMDNLIIYPESMRKNLERTKGLVFSQKLLLELVRKGALRDEAYKIVQRNAMVARQEGRDFKELMLSDSGARDFLSESQIEDCFDYGYYLRHVDKIFSRLGIDDSTSSPSS